MSRTAKKPVEIVDGVNVKLEGQVITISKDKSSLSCELNSKVEIAIDGNLVKFNAREGQANAWAQAGTARSLVHNMIEGVTKGFEKKLTLSGVGYRANVKGSTLSLTLGFSHPVEFAIPQGISIECPSATEVIIKGIDKQQVGQVAANIAKYRPTEPYKGKGIAIEGGKVVKLKEAKKK